MLSKRRARKATIALESLDDRIVPSGMGVRMTQHAALEARLALQAEHRMQIMEMREARMHAQLEARQAMMAAHRHQPAFAAHAASHAGAHHTVRMTILGVNPKSGSEGRAGGSIATTVSGQGSTGSSSSTSSQGTGVQAQNSSSGSTNSERALPANVDQALDKVYQDYQAYVSGGSSGDFTTSESATIVVSGTNVGINAHGNNSGDFDAYVAALSGLGMQVQTTDATTETVVGLIPISALPDAAKLAQTFSLTPMYKPRLA